MAQSPASPVLPQMPQTVPSAQSALIVPTAPRRGQPTRRRSAERPWAPTAALLYRRVSSAHQAQEGLSLDTQQGALREYAAGKGFVIHREYEDVLSGKRDDRPAYQAMLADARRLRAEGAPVVIVVLWLDRLGRRMKEAVWVRDELKLLGVAVHSVREGGEVDDLRANIMASVAEHEVQRLSERVSDNVQRVKHNGWPGTSRTPWGYRWRPTDDAERKAGAMRSTLDRHEAEAPYVVEAFARAASGETVHAVARWASGLPGEARGGRTLSFPTVLRLLKSPTYISRQPLPRAETAQGARLEAEDVRAVLASPVCRWPALVEDAVWATVQARIGSHARVPRQGGRGDYVLSGLVYCPVCGAAGVGSRMTGATATIKKTAPSGAVTRYTARRYRCSAGKGGATSRQGCRFEAHAGSLEADARRQVATLLDAFLGDATDRRDTRAAYELLRRPQTRAGADTAKKLAGIEAGVARAQAAITGATEKYVLDKLTEAQYRAVTVKLEGDLRRLEQERGALLHDQQARAALPDLPEWDALLAEATDWQRITANAQDAQTGDPQALRGVLVALIDRLEPKKAGYARYEAAITWTPKGHALAVAAGLVTTGTAETEGSAAPPAAPPAQGVR